MSIPHKNYLFHISMLTDSTHYTYFILFKVYKNLLFNILHVNNILIALALSSEFKKVNEKVLHICYKFYDII